MRSWLVPFVVSSFAFQDIVNEVDARGCRHYRFVRGRSRHGVFRRFVWGRKVFVNRDYA